MIDGRRTFTETVRRSALVSFVAADLRDPTLYARVDASGHRGHWPPTARRNTLIPPQIFDGLSDAFAADPGKQWQWEAFARGSLVRSPDLVTSSATFAREGQSSWGRTDFPSLPPFRSAVEASNWPASTILAVVLPHEGMLPVGLLSFRVLFESIKGRRLWACGRRRRRWATQPRSGALFTIAAGAPQAHRPNVHGLPGPKRPAPSVLSFL